jgi:hypothetical protein
MKYSSVKVISPRRPSTTPLIMVVHGFLNDVGADPVRHRFHRIIRIFERIFERIFGNEEFLIAPWEPSIR